MHAGIPSCYIDIVPKLQEMSILLEVMVSYGVFIYMETVTGYC